MAKNRNTAHAPECDSCGEIMKLEKSGSVNVERGTCRIRRFKCDLCDVKKTIYANGYVDEDVVQWIGEQDQKKLFKQQEDYNKNFK